MYCGRATHGNIVMLAESKPDWSYLPHAWGESQLCPRKGSSLHFAIVTTTPCCHMTGLAPSSSWQGHSGHVNSSLLCHSCPLHTPLSFKLIASPQSSSFLGFSMPRLSPHVTIARFHPAFVSYQTRLRQPVSLCQRHVREAPHRPHRDFSLWESLDHPSPQPSITARLMLALNRALDLV